MERQMQKLAKFGAVIAMTAGLILGGGTAAHASYPGPNDAACHTVPTSTTVTTGTPGTNYWKLVQCYASKQGNYVGPINGIMGYNSWYNLELGVQGNGCPPVPIDGTSAGGGYALQCLGRISGGYTGPFNGIPGPNTYKNSAGYLNYLALTVWHYE
jgi:hypothetical protein